MSVELEDTDLCDKQYMCALDIYLMTLLLSPYSIIMHHAINSTSHGNIVVYGLNATGKCSLKEQMELIGKLEGNYKSKIRMLTIALK